MYASVEDRAYGWSFEVSYHILVSNDNFFYNQFQLYKYCWLRVGVKSLESKLKMQYFTMAKPHLNHLVENIHSKWQNICKVIKSLCQKEIAYGT
jgi:hypothetical protein